MQGVFVAVVPVFVAAFALLMDRFESSILTRPAPESTESSQTA